MSNVVKKSGIFEPPTKPKITKEMKANMAKSGLDAAAQKQALEEQLNAAKAQYVEDMAVWNAKPTTDPQTVAALKSEFQEFKASVPKKKEEIIKTYNAEVAEAASMQPFERKVALMKAKEKKHNAILDLNEAQRVRFEAYENAIESPAQIFKRKKRVKTLAAIWRDKYLYLMLVPFIAWYAVFHYLPMYGITLAFRERKTFRPLEADFLWNAGKSPFLHFETFLKSDQCYRLFRNTIVINLMSLVLGFPLPIIFALLLNELRSKLYKTAVQTISYLPHFISAVVVAGLVTNFLAPTGMINTAISAIFKTEVTTDYLGNPAMFRWIYVLMGIWQGTGFGSIIYTSALAGVDQELYEAAHIDGAGRWKQMLHITIPGIMPTIAIMLIMRLGGLLNVGYETIILLYRPATYETADVISSYVYRIGLQPDSGTSTNYNLSTAVGLFNAIISLIFVSISNTVSRKLGDVGLW